MKATTEAATKVKVEIDRVLVKAVEKAKQRLENIVKEK